MNKLKIDMVSFLMRSFDDYVGVPNGIAIFKSNIEDLVYRNQIYPEVQNIIYRIYGIVNTNTYKASVCQEKVYKISMYLSRADMLKIVENQSATEHFKKCIDNDFKVGFINNQIKDILYDIFDFNVKKEETIKQSNKQDSILIPPTIKKSSEIPKSSKKDELITQLMAKGVSQQVLNDICLFKEEYWDPLYYYYPNENYDGCSNSSPYLHTALLKALIRPKGSVIKLYKKVADDGCHATWAYIDIPKDCYIKPKIETPKGTGRGIRGISSCDSISSRSRIC